MTFAFLSDDDAEVAEAWHRDSGYQDMPFVDAFWDDDPYNAIYERDVQELGLSEALAFQGENDTTDCRRWEREDVIYHRWRQGAE